MDTHLPTLIDSGNSHFIPEPDLPLTGMQRAMLAEEAEYADKSRYNIAVAFRIDDGLDQDRLQNALNAVIARHEVFRTIYPSGPDGPLMAIAPEPGDILQREHRSEPDFEARCREHAAEPFDLAREVPIRALLIDDGAGKHAFSLVLHHIAADGVTLDLLIRDLEAAYRGEQLPEPHLHFADWAAWLEESLQAGALDDAIAMTAAQIADADLDLDLPPRKEDAGSTLQPVLLDAASVKTLAEAAQAQGITPLTLFAGAFLLTFSRLLDRDDLAFAIPLPLRDRPELQQTAGCLINTMPVAAAIPPHCKAADWLRQLAATLLDALDRRHAPLDRVLHQRHRVGGPRDAPRLFFNFFEGELRPPEFSGCSVDVIDIERATGKFDLMLSLRRHPQGLDGGFDVTDGLLADRGAVPPLPELFQRALIWLSENADKPLSRFQLVDDEAASPLIGPASRAASAPLHDRVFAVAAKHSDRPALRYQHGTISHSEMAARAKALAAALQGQGIARGDRVAVLMPRCPALPIAMLGVMASGAAYIPLDPLAPPARWTEVLDDGQVAAVVTVTAFGRGDLADTAHVICLAEDGRLTAATDEDFTALETPVTDPAYLIYTSGSTGHPKGVVISHANVTRYLDWAIEAYGLSEGCVTATVTATAFDATILSFWAPLLMGGCIDLLPDQEALEGLLDRLRNGPMPEFVKCTPAHLAMLLERITPPELCGEPPLLVVGGDALPGPLAQRWIEQFRGRLVNEYGPTETTVGCSIFEPRSGDEPPVTVPIGKPISGARLYVLDRRLNPVPPGMVGALYIGGDGVGQGYWRRPGLTALRFIADPFSPQPGARMYDSGDRVRLRDDGGLDYLGRSDDQIKLRGHRIEPGEIEAVLRDQPGIRDAAVILVGSGLEARLVAFVTGTVSESIRAELAARLPEALLPDQIMPLDRLPLTRNDKVDVKALIALADEQKSDGVVDKDLIAVLTAYWSEALGAQASADTDFFNAGGNSLKAIRLLAKIKRELSSAPSFADLAAAPTPETLALRLTPAAPQASTVQDTKPVASPGERQLWLDQQIAENGSAFVMQAAFTIARPVDLKQLERAVRELGNRHEILRTLWPAGQDGPDIAISAEAQAAISLDQGRDVSRELVSLARDQALLGFDLDVGPCWRLAALSDGGKTGIVLTAHHILCDGVSMAVLVEDLVALLLDRQPAPTPETYRSFAAQWTQDLAARREIENRFWHETLDGAPPYLDLPLDRKRHPGHQPRGGLVELSINAGLADAAAALAQRSNTTLHSVLLAAYALLLNRLGNGQELLIGIPVSRRPEKHENTVGLYLNTLPLRLDADAAKDGLDLINRISTDRAALMSHALLPYSAIVETLRPARRDHRPPLMHTVLDWQEQAEIAEGLDGSMLIEGVKLQIATAPFDLALSLRGSADGSIDGGLIFDADLLDAETVAGWRDAMIAILNAIVAEPDAPPAAIMRKAAAPPLIGPTPPATSALEDELRHQLAKHGDRPAVINGERTVTYRDLTEASSPETAERLTIIETDDPVARITAAVTAILTGGAFALIDPALPQARRETMRAMLTAAAADLSEDAAYIQFTSGSTGRPKAAILPRKGLSLVARVIAQTMQIEPGARVLQLAAPAFDAWVWEVFTTLFGGGTLIAAERNALAAGAPLADTLRQQRITHMTATPSVLAALPDDDYPDLSVIVAAGEALSTELAARWAMGRRLLNGYGPCEATICAAYDICDGRETPTIGKPLPGLTLSVRDGSGDPVLQGMKGELWIAGPTVGFGYLDDAERSAAAFFEADGQRWYRSGDIVRLGSDGKLRFHGRRDRQVKIRGVRIELDEIEAALQRLPQVTHAAAITLPGSDGLPMLAAYVAGPAAGSESALRTALGVVLPETMLPSQLRVLHAMPMTPTGKIDRRALAEWDGTAPATPDRPATAEETVIAQAMAEVLNRAEPPSPDANFFTIGGHSLLAVRLAALLGERLGREVPLPLLFAHASPAALSNALASESTGCHLRTLREGDGSPVFLLHPVDGSGRCYHDLAAAWPGPQRLIAVEQTSSFDSLDALAACYADAILAEAEEPIRLLGWSLGAVLAASLARYLANKGRTTHLILIDAAAPQAGQGAGADSTEIDNAVAEAGGDAVLRRRVAANLRLVEDWRDQGELKNTVHVIKAADTPRDQDDLGWSRIFPRCRVHSHPGTHQTILHDNPQALAALLHDLYAEEQEHE